MDRKTWMFMAAGAAALVVAGVMLAPKFLPKDEVVLNQALPPTMDADEADPQAAPEVVVDRAGSWRDGDAAHKASGTIELVHVDGSPYLRFTDFAMTSGPDVYLYLTPSADPQSKADVETNGVRIPVITEEDRDARLNERGTFFVAIDVPDLASFQGVAAWCDDFNVLFGNATLA